MPNNKFHPSLNTEQLNNNILQCLQYIQYNFENFEKSEEKNMVICFAEYCDHANKSHHCHHFLFSKEERHWVQRMRTDKVNWITAHNCGKLKWHSFMSSSCWKGGNFGSWHCLTKWALENKLINETWWSWYNFFSGEVTSYTDTSYCIHILWDVCRSVFFCFMALTLS